MPLPPLSYDLSFNKSSRRITTIIKKHWEFIKNDRSFPSESEIHKSQLEKVWENCFIVKADNSCVSHEDYKYIFMGRM